MNAIVRIRDGFGEVSAPTADLLLANAKRLGARTGSAFEVSPPRKAPWGSLWLVLALSCCAAMCWGAVLAKGQ